MRYDVAPDTALHVSLIPCWLVLLVTAVTEEIVGLPHNVVVDAVVALVPEQVGVDKVTVTDRFCPLFNEEIKYGLLVIKVALPVPAPDQVKLY